ncbi:MAG: hypothetical protein ACSHXK_07475 [Oceanococcus sp.]
MKTIKTALLLLMSVALLSACSDSSSGNGFQFKVSGTALSVVDGSPQANRDFDVIDLAKTGDDKVVADGSSDASGGFAIKILGDSRNLIVEFGATDSEPRTSGLFSLLENSTVTKSLDNATDIACQAGVEALADGLAPTDLDAKRISNLEQAATQVLASQSVDFKDPDSIQNAVDEVRSLTNDGAEPPPQ